MAAKFDVVPPSPRSVLELLPKARLLELSRELGVVVKRSATKEDQVGVLARKSPGSLPAILRALGRDELKRACRAHDLDDTGRSREELRERILGACNAVNDTREPSSLPAFRLMPLAGDIVNVRQRQYLVTEVVPPASEGAMSLVRLVCLDDDAQGRPLEVLWELELGARVIQPETQAFDEIEALDEPSAFAAYFHAIKWNRVTATDGKLFQSPFRAGIALKSYQLTPLRKALELPRANLFIADDVGLGKTIEAGLVVQELLLRQRIDWVLIVCPASVTLQWKSEMERRFGLSFEIYSRELVARRRQERGFQVNPWSTHNRFIVSYQTFRRPEYRDALIHELDARPKKSLLVLDEAHTAAPATASKYALDSLTTKAIRDLSGRFASKSWTARRVIVFTEYGHTKTYLRKLLESAIEGTDRAQERIRVFDGGMSEENRALLPPRFRIAFALRRAATSASFGTTLSKKRTLVRTMPRASSDVAVATKPKLWPRSSRPRFASLTRPSISS